jgi:rare lipoprotein A
MRKTTVALLGLITMVLVDLVSPNRTNARTTECPPEVPRIQVKASWYGSQHHGKKTKSGERFNMFAMTAASNRIRIGSKVRLYNPKTKKVVVVRINDTGGFEKYGRQLDVSLATATKLGFRKQGVATLQVCVLKPKVRAR